MTVDQWLARHPAEALLYGVDVPGVKLQTDAFRGTPWLEFPDGSLRSADGFVVALPQLIAPTFVLARWIG